MTSVLSSLFFAQVGINTPTPQATFDVVAKKTDGTTSEGIIAPRLTGNQIKSADAQYDSPQTGTLVYAMDAVNGATTKTVNITTAGYYYFDGKIWQKMGNNPSTFTGDIKHSARVADHGGWYLLNGRAISSLPAAAQIAAASLGFAGTIPNATDRVLKTKTAAEAMAATGGTNTISIARTNLPAFNFAGTLSGDMTAAGAHTHTVTGSAAANGQHTHSISGSTNAAGNHRHAPHESSRPRPGRSGAALFLFGNSTLGNNGTGNYSGNFMYETAWGGVGAASTTGISGNHAHSLSGSAVASGNHGHTLNISAAQAANHTHSLANVNVTVPSGGTGATLDNRSPYLVVNTYIYLGE